MMQSDVLSNGPTGEGEIESVLEHFYQRKEKQILEVELFRCHLVSILDSRKNPLLQVSKAFKTCASIPYPAFLFEAICTVFLKDCPEFVATSKRFVIMPPGAPEEELAFDYSCIQSISRTGLFGAC